MVGASLGVLALVLSSGLPAFAVDLDAAAPGFDDPVGMQQLTVGAGVDAATPTVSDWLAAAAARSWVAPVPGELRDGFGPRLARPVAGASPFHRGQDLGAACGEPVRASAAGTVRQAGWFGTYGNWVLIDHGNGVTTGYAHNSLLKVVPGQRVQAGQVISRAGTTGASSGCHVHLEVRSGTTAVDPLVAMRQRGVRLG